MRLSAREFWAITPRLLVSMLEEKRKIDMAKIKRLAFQTAGAVWGKDIDDEQEKVIDSPFQ